MANPDDMKPSGEIQIGDIFVPLWNYRHLIWHATIAATALALLIGGIYFAVQPITWSSSLEFRPLFGGAQAGFYPNRLPFASSDIIDPTVLDQVYDKNHLQGPCSRDEFRAAFVVEETSPELLFLDLAFQAQLSDAKITAVDRERLQNEYRSRRQGLPVQYKLTWLRPEACRGVPDGVVSKALGEVLQTWAEDADLKRGALKVRVAVLTPGIFDFGKLYDQSLLIRADLIRSALNRVVTNIREVELLPGAELVRIGADRTSFAQVRSRLQDLVQVHLDPLVAVAGRGMGAEAARWVEESLSIAVVQQKGAEERANAYQTALREYSGLTAAPTTVGQRPQTSSDVQTLTPQIDRTFIDRIVELSSINTTFRQELTRSMVTARVAAVDSASAAEHYRVLLASLKNGVFSSLSAADVDRRLATIVDEGREQVRQFNALYEEFSRVSLRSGPLMYRVERPSVTQTVRAFTLRSLALLVFCVFLATPVGLSLGCLVHHGVVQIAKRPLRA